MRGSDRGSNVGEGGPESAFWRTHVHTGVALYTAGAAGVLAYAAATPHGPHRFVIAVVDGVSLLASVTVFWWCALRLLDTRWRTAFFSGWTVCTLGTVGAAALLDGGVTSPLTYLLVLPLLFAGLAYTPRAVTFLAGVAVATALAVGAASPRAHLGQTAVLTMATAIAGALSVTTARNRRRLLDQLVQLADYDGLTGGLTRRAFHRRLQHEALRAERHGHCFSVVMADVDDLKALNDTDGHAAGDASLLRLVEVLTASLRGTDLVGRLGGDEFGVLLPETGAEQAAGALARLREAVRSDSTLPTGVSFGVATWAGPGDSPDALLHRADMALYTAKHGRRGPDPGRPGPATGDAPRVREPAR